MRILRAFLAAARLARVVALLAVIAEYAFALDPNHRITQYGHTAWTVTDGRLPGAVYALAQTKDGWLWVGTAFGLLQFDGVRFSRLTAPDDEPARTGAVSALAPDPGGGLWIGTRHSLSHWNGLTTQPYQNVDRALGAVNSIHVDRRGTVWVGIVGFRSGGVGRLERNGMRFYGRTDGYGGGGVNCLTEDHLGDVWVGSMDGLYRWNGSGVFQKLGPNIPMKPVVGIAETPDAGVILVDNAGSLKRFAGGSFQDYLAARPRPKFVARAILTDRDGGVWIGTNSEGLIHVYRSNIDYFTHADGLSSDTILSLSEDREGNIWAGTERGLDRFRDLPVTTISKREGLSDDTAGSAFASRSGGVWIGTAIGLNRVQGRQITVFNRASGLPSEHIGSVFEGRGGEIWVDSLKELALGLNGVFHPLAGGEQLRSISSVTEDRDGVFWFADSERGLVKVQDNEIKTVAPWSEFQNKQAWALDADLAHGGLLMGFAQGGAAYYREGVPTRWYTVSDGLGVGAVTDIRVEADGTAWIATLGGLSRLHDGRAMTLTTANGLACNPIHAIVEDEQGALWLNSPCGLQSISRKDLIKWAASPDARVRPRIYSVADGMRVTPTQLGHFRRAVRSGDGLLWFPVLIGVAVVDPKRLHENPLPPPVAIESLRVDDKWYSLTPDLRVDPIRRELQIDYTALTLVDPERVQFRYKLEGRDAEWHSVLGRRQAFYTDLAPRHYRFRVTACNNSGIWNETGAVLEFSVAPMLHQTVWFRLFCVAAGASMLWALHVARLRSQRARIQAGYEERAQERTRIGRELHDTLLQNVAALALQLGGLSKVMVRDPQAALEQSRELRREIEQWLREAREAVWDLRSGEGPLLDFCDAVRHSGEQITQDTPVRFIVAIHDSSQTVPPAAQKELLKIVGEAVRNAVRHSQATEVRVDVFFPPPGDLQVRIRDNGCGFDLETASRKEGHWGLVGMRERARRLGAEFSLESVPGRGTEVRVNLRNIHAPERSADV